MVAERVAVIAVGSLRRDSLEESFLGVSFSLFRER
jgi:hypothetical protein